MQSFLQDEQLTLHTFVSDLIRHSHTLNDQIGEQFLDLIQSTEAPINVVVTFLLMAAIAIGAHPAMEDHPDWTLHDIITVLHALLSHIDATVGNVTLYEYSTVNPDALNRRH